MRTIKFYFILKGDQLMIPREAYKFSIKIITQDLAIVNCLRALSQFSQKTENNRIPWGGTKDKDWRNDDYCVTFRFSTVEYRHGFIKEVERLLPKDLLIIKETNDNNPPK